LGELNLIYVDWSAGFPMCGERDLALTLHFMSQFCIGRRSDCNLLEEVAGLLSMARTALSSAKVAYVASDEVGRSAVNRKYSNGPETGLRYACFSGEEFSVLVSKLVEEMPVLQVRF
jgi:hypothetical protein